MARSGPLTITLPADVAAQMQTLIDRGGYATDHDVLRDAMHALQQRSTLRELRAKIDASIDDPRPSLTAEEVEEHFARRAAAILAREGRA